MRSTFLSALVMLNLSGMAQTPVAEVLAANVRVDACVVEKDTQCMKELYADDYVFTHGTGLVDNKDSWLKAVENPESRYVSRVQDSTTVEMHDDVAIVTGRLAIERERNQQISKYGVWYVRVFVWKSNRWQLISHRTTRYWR